VIETVQQYRHLDHEVLIDSTNHRDAAQWCEEQLGKRWEAMSYRSGRWCMFWAGRNNFDKYRFCFALEQDKLVFMLRWM
jgi:hypothetical protein